MASDSKSPENEQQTDGGELPTCSGLALCSCSVLFARSDSVYKDLGVDVWDKDRNALSWPGGNPVIAHPPCRAWGRLRHFANPAPGEKALAAWAVYQVREFGGVLEHPASSTLWREINLPDPGGRDDYGGWTLAAPQWWWGHKAEKATLFYVCGCEPSELPEIPFKLGEPEYVIQSRKRSDYRPHVSKAEREHTPRDLAEWLIAVASICRPNAKGLLADGSAATPTPTDTEL